MLFRNKARDQGTDGISSEAISDLNLLLGVMESNSAVRLQVRHRGPYFEERAGRGAGRGRDADKADSAP